jgi:dTDP-4-dehydrorhamnose reductase
LDRFADLGIKALRHPVLWESSALDEAFHWERADRSLHRLGELGIRPIVGLLHHGSGPKSTDLLDEDFPSALALYAEQVARRYPDVEDYTPINEPLTTARFSCLYGHWFPHQRNDFSFSRALLNQCRGISLTMQAIRHIRPSARLIQTEDLGLVFSTPKLSYQAEFENDRRWSTFDLLSGQVDRDHPMWSYFRWAGIDDSELSWFVDHPCPPDVIGINHYLSGQRYLDENIERYANQCCGGNGRDVYADMLAARVLPDGPVEPEQFILEAWNRYKLPVAVTECHNGCTREEQLRWFVEVWNGAERARMQEARVVAVTAWSLLGAFDWDSLVTQRNLNYESGVFDVRSGEPRPTALATTITSLAEGRPLEHPVLEIKGWWRRPERFLYGFYLDDQGTPHTPDHIAHHDSWPSTRPVLITGGRGTLARAFTRICQLRGIPFRALTRTQLDVADPTSIRHAISSIQPWAIINAAGYVRVDDAQSRFEECFRENTEGPRLLADECARKGIQFLTFSSDLVFDGLKKEPYVESDTVSPVNQYGRSKAAAETLVRQLMSTALIVRTSAFFSPWDEFNFLVTALRSLSARELFRAAHDAIVSPTYIPDLVHACLDLLIDGEHGLWHVANKGQISWAALAHETASLAKIDSDSLESCELAELRLPATRPRFSVLTSERAVLLPTLENAMERFVRDCEVDLSAVSFRR